MFELKINTTGQAFARFGRAELARIIHEVAWRLEHTDETEGAIRDLQGHDAAHWTITSDPFGCVEPAHSPDDDNPAR